MTGLLDKLRALEDCGVSLSRRVRGSRYESIDLDVLVPEVIAEIEELTKRADEAEEEIEALKRRFEELEAEAVK